MNVTEQHIEISPNSFKKGVWAIFPMLLGTAPFGIIFGAFALDMGIGIEGEEGIRILFFDDYNICICKCNRDIGSFNIIFSIRDIRIQYRNFFQSINCLIKVQIAIN